MWTLEAVMTRVARKCTAGRKGTDMIDRFAVNCMPEYVGLAITISTSGHDPVEARTPSHGNEHGAFRRGVRLADARGARDRGTFGGRLMVSVVIPWLSHFIMTKNFLDGPKGVIGTGGIIGTRIVIGLMEHAPSCDPVMRQDAASTEGADAVMLSYVGMVALAPACMKGQA